MSALDLISQSILTSRFTPITIAYLAYLIQPYIDSLTEAITVDQIINWVPEVFPVDQSDSLILDILNATNQQAVASSLSDIDNAKREVALEFVGILIEGCYLSAPLDTLSDLKDHEISPWLIAFYKTELAQMLFGPPLTQLPVTVIVNGDESIHDLTEEFTTGLVSVFATPRWVPRTSIQRNNVRFLGIRLQPTMFRFAISPDEQQYKIRPEEDFIYTADVGLLRYGFNSIDFIHGVQSASNLLGLDSKIVIPAIREVKTGNLLQIQ